LLLQTRCDNSRFRYARAQPKELPGEILMPDGMLGAAYQ